MKKVILAALLATIGLVSCSSCATKSPPAPEPVPTVVPVVDAGPPPPDASKTLSVTGEGWELTLPDNGWEVQQACKQDGSCLTIMVNDDLHNLMLVLRRNDDESLEAFTLREIRAAKDSGATVRSTKQLTMNGHNFVLVEATKDNAKVFVWITLSNGVGYEFSCGGPNDDGRQDKLCTGVASTLKIK